jgi:hypothetical protein
MEPIAWVLTDMVPLAGSSLRLSGGKKTQVLRGKWLGFSISGESESRT